MAPQNLISAVLAPETKAEILAKIEDIKSSLSFLLSLKTEDIKSLIKVGNNYMPFLDKAYAAAIAHPEIIPKLFDMEEFGKDYRLSKDLQAIAIQIEQLEESLSNTLTAVNSDVMTSALEVYTAAKQNSNRVPGLSVVVDELGEFFKRTRRKPAVSS